MKPLIKQKLYEALKTKCQTKDAVYDIKLTDKLVKIEVKLPSALDLTESEAELLEANLHNVIEVVLSKYFKE